MGCEAALAFLLVDSEDGDDEEVLNGEDGDHGRLARSRLTVLRVCRRVPEMDLTGEEEEWLDTLVSEGRPSSLMGDITGSSSKRNFLRGFMLTS